MKMINLFVRGGVYIFVFSVLIFFVIVKQNMIMNIRNAEVVSPINEWKKNGKPVEVVVAKKETFFAYNRITAELKQGSTYVSYITQEEKIKFKEGQKVYRDANNNFLLGKIVLVSNSRDIDKGMFKVVVQITEKTSVFNNREILFVCTKSLNNVVKLPLAAFDLEDKKYFVKKVVDSKIIKVFVDLGDIDREFFVVNSGVNPGDLIVVNGGTLVNDGDFVSIRKDKKE